MISKSQRWQKTALAVATATVMGLWGSQASALSLGRIAVLSALGEPLRAEIEILDINADEASSLRANVAQQDAFSIAGLEYNAVMTGLQITLQQRTDGRSYLRVSSSRPINDPYVDLILEASWSSGRIVRDYTMLFDPPNLKQPQAVTSVVPQASSVPVRIAAPQLPPVQPASEPVAETPTPAPSAPASAAAETQPPAESISPAAAPAPAAQTAPVAAPESAAVPAPVAAPESAAMPAPAAQTEPVAAPAPAVATVKRVTIKSGDTASRIAVSQKPAGVSLDQMLVAMQRVNPDAFSGGNINRLRSGAVLNMPGAEEASATPASEARQIVIAQSKDFNEYRSKLASSAPLSQVTAADRKASGTVQAKVEEKKTATAAPDKLTLSKGAVQGKVAEDKIAKELVAKEAAARTEEVSKNIADLNKLSKASEPTAAATAKPAVQAPAPVPAPAPAASAAKPVVAPTVASAPSAPAPTPAPVAAAPAPKPKAPAPAAAPAAEPELIDELLDNPLVLAAAGGLVALLAGLGFYRIRQRKNVAQVDSAYLESRLQPDSFFGASGGQRVDTNDNGVTGSSMVYSPSQLDAGGDVDPVAEADVYLAYGRDLQAEEILKEALRTHPSRLAIHQKLLEIYTKRRDPKNFETIAKAAFKLTGTSGQEWEHICELGRSVDPSNALYQPGGAPPPISAPAAPQEMDTRNISTTTRPTSAPTAAPASAMDLDLDLDFSLDEAPPSAISEAASRPPQSRPAAPPSAPARASQSMEFDAPLPELATQPQELPGRSASPSPLAPAESAKASMMEFDLGSLSLDLGTPSEQPSVGSDDPLGTKLALAEEFSAIGDTDGARALIEEIIAEASGEMKSKAQKALSQLG